MSEIIPAVMPKNWQDLEESISTVAHVAPKIQIDIMDGNFVKGKTWPYADDSHFADLSSEKETLPFWEEVQYELDMMISNPKEEISKWVACGISKAIYHIDSSKNILDAVKHFNDNYRLQHNPAGVLLFIAVPFNAKPEDISGLSEMIDGIQIMGIDPVGVQGSVFREETIKTVSLFRKAYPEIKISVDGGIKEEQIKPLTEAGADMLAVGSAIFASDDPLSQYEHLSEIASGV